MIGETLGTYQVIERVGAGGFAQVFRATNTGTGDIVALKVLRDEYCEDPEFLRRFQQEAALLLTLPPHPNVARAYEYGTADRFHFLAMEFVDGSDLAELLKISGLLPIDQALSVAQQVAEALQCAHAHHIVHRDIKPQNVKLTPQGVAKVLDFGIARAAEGAKLTRTGVFIGTPEYLAPEIWEGQEADARSDIYAWGVLVYELLAGRPPFTADTAPALMRQHLSAVAAPLSSIRRELPPGYGYIVERALARWPQERFQSVREVLDALRSPQTYSAPAAPARAPARPQQPPPVPVHSRTTPNSAASRALPAVLRGDAFLVGMRGAPTGHSYALRAGMTYVGRDPSLPISLADGLVSGRHASIQRSPQGYVLADLGSRNGTYVNGRRLANAVLLSDGDQVRLGQSDFVFRAVGMPGPNQLQSAGLTASRDNMLAALCHLTVLTSLFNLVIPLVFALVPIAIWLLGARRSRELGYHARQAFLYQAIVGLLMLFLERGNLPAAFVVWLLSTAYGAYAAFRSMQGREFRYPIVGAIAGR